MAISVHHPRGFVIAEVLKTQSLFDCFAECYPPLLMFKRFCLLALLLLAAFSVHASPGFSQQIARGESFLTNLFDAELDLVAEFEGSRTYWLFHDNYLAAHLLETSR